MADEIIGAVGISIEGDYSGLQADFDAAASIAAGASKDIAAEFDALLAGSNGLSEATDTVAVSLQAAGSSAEGVAAEFEAWMSAAQTSGAAAEELDSWLAQYNQTAGETAAAGASAAEGVQKTGEAAQQAGDSAHHASEGFSELGRELIGLAGIALTAEGLKELATEAIHAYGGEQALATSLELMGASATEARERTEDFKNMAIELGVPLEELERSARQGTAAFGVGEGLTQALIAAANSAAVTGRSFESVFGGLERIALTGQVSSRQLVALGLSWEDMARSMGISVEEAQDRLKKGNQDALTDLSMTLYAVQEKFGDAAHRQAQNLEGEITQVKNRIEVMFEDLGKEIAGGMQGIEAVVKSIITAFDIFLAVIRLADDNLAAFSAIVQIYFQTVAQFADDMAHGRFRQAMTTVENGFMRLQQQAKFAGEQVRSDLQSVGSQIAELWEQPEQKYAATIEKPKLPPMEGDETATAVQETGAAARRTADDLDVMGIMARDAHAKLAGLAKETAHFNEVTGQSLDIMGYLNASVVRAFAAEEQAGDIMPPMTAAIDTQAALVPHLTQAMSNLATAATEADQKMLSADKLHATNAALRDWIGQAVTIQSVYANMGQAVMHGFDNIGQSMARAIIQGKGFADAMKASFSAIGATILGTIITALIKLAAQWVITLIAGKALSKQLSDSQISGQAGYAGAAAFASVMAAVPFPVNVALAPAVGAAAMAAAMAFRLGTMEQGGRANADMLTMVHAGESWYTEAQTGRIEAALAGAGAGAGGPISVTVNVTGVVTHDIVDQIGTQIASRIRQLVGPRKNF